MKIAVGSRGSKLALTQTQWVIEKLRNENPEVEFEIRIIKTKGDKITDVALDKIGDKGIFVKEIETELLNGEIDIAVHSMKDMPSNIPKGLKLAAVPEREDYRDVLILRDDFKSLSDVPRGGRIGTGSKRRKYQLLKIRPDLDIVPIRGNIDTRIGKIEEMNLHGIVLSAAGLKRLGLEDRITSYLEKDEFLPAPAQGALAIEIRENDKKIEDMISKIAHRETEIQVRAERALLNSLNGSCHIPVGALCDVNGDDIILYGLLGSENGEWLIRKTAAGKVGEEELLGKRLAEELLKEMKKLEG